MLDIKYIKEHAAAVKENCKNRNIKVDIDRLLVLDEKRRAGLARVEALRQERNVKSKSKPTDEERALAKQLGEEIKEREKEQKQIEEEYHNLLLSVPNLSDPAAPVGGADEFVILSEHNSPPKFKFKPKTHDQLMEALDLLDFERGAKVAGAKFYFVKREAVRLNLALINYGLDILSKHGFTLLETPDLVKNNILDGSGFNPRGAEAQTYEIKNHDSILAIAQGLIGHIGNLQALYEFFCFRKKF